jgi:putative serine protease PepD
MRSSILVIVLAATIAGAIAGGIVGATLENGDAATTTAASTTTIATPAASAPSVPTRGLSAEQIYRNDAPGVVVITDTQTQVTPPTFFAPGGKQQVGALGSGFVIDKQGDILTNDHVVQGATSIRVGFSGGASAKASIVGTDHSSDLAIIRVKVAPSALRPLSFGDVAGMQVGDPVYAIGNPFGLDRTMTAGIVSATGRDIQSPNGLTIPDAIQTDAPINHGNSGGPLIDRFGRVVGVNAQIQGGTVNANVGVGFAISAATAKSVSEQLIETGHAKHAYLGVEVMTIDPSLAGVMRGLPSHGVAVARVVKGSPAAEAGLTGATREVTVNGVTIPLGGDTIVALDGKSLTSSTQLADAVARHKPGDKLKLEIVRGGAKRTVEVTLGNAPQ